MDNELIKFDTSSELPNIIKVIGVGGGGSNAVTHMFTEGIQGVDFILCNTDHQALIKSPVANKVHLGKRALGAGNVPAVGRQAAIETTEELKEILGKDTKMLFITAGMGGGTGTGAAPIVASIARELDILTVGIVTMPFAVEGKRRHQQAMDGIAELRKHVDTLLVISNDKLRTEYGDMKLTQAFKKADDVLKTAAKGIAEIITVTGYVNVDFQDVNTVMRNSGKAIMGSGSAEGEDRALRAVEEAVHSPLLDDSDISGAKNILLYITSGSDEVSLDEVLEIQEYVQNSTGDCSEVIWGNGIDESLGKAINVTLIATGFDEDAETPNRTEDKIVYPLSRKQEETAAVKAVETVDEETEKPKIEVVHKKEKEEKTNVGISEPQKKVHRLDDDEDVSNNAGGENIYIQRPSYNESNSRQPEPNPVRYTNPIPDDDDESFEIKSYVRDSADTQTQVMAKHKVATDKETERQMLRRSRLESLNMNFRSAAFYEELEKEPAYARKGLQISTDDEEQELSNYSSNKNKGINENNSFLHANID